MQRRWKRIVGAAIIGAGAGIYLQWMHDWRPSCRNVPSAAEAAQWLNGLSSTGKPFAPTDVACIEFAAFDELDSRVGMSESRARFPHPGIGVQYESRPSPEGFAKLKDLPRLTVVEFRTFTVKRRPSPDYSDAVAASIGQYKGLTSVNWSESAMTDAGLRHLARIETLERLVMGDASLGSGLASLAGLRRLRVLELRAAVIAAPGITAFAGLAHVTELSLDPAQLTGDLSPIARMPALRWLSLQEAKIDEDQIASLSGAPELQGLELHRARIGPRGMAGLAGNPKLEGLSIAYGRIEGGFEVLARAPALRRLNLFAAEIDDASAAGIAKMARLEWLRLAKTAVGDATAAALAALPRLEYLDLDETGVTDAAVASIAKMPRLREISLKSTKLTDAGRAKLSAEKPDLKVR